MKYVALLRGINVGGNAVIKMADLKKTVEDAGFNNVLTYIQSGNIIFKTEETDKRKIEMLLENVLSKSFLYHAKVVIYSHKEFAAILDDIPKIWITRKDIRCYIAFIKEPTTADDVLQEVYLQNNIDYVKKGRGVIYMTTLTTGLMKSGFTKLIGKKIYQQLTMRNYTTSQKLLLLMDK